MSDSHPTVIFDCKENEFPKEIVIYSWQTALFAPEMIWFPCALLFEGN